MLVQLHEALREHFQGLASTTTVDGTEKCTVAAVLLEASQPALTHPSSPMPVIRVFRGSNRQRQVRQQWPEDRPEYLRFVLHKANCVRVTCLQAVDYMLLISPTRLLPTSPHGVTQSTSRAVSMLAGHLRVKPRAFGYAGQKDKRAVTSQLMTIHRVCAPLASLQLHPAHHNGPPTTRSTLTS